MLPVLTKMHKIACIRTSLVKEHPLFNCIKEQNESWYLYREHCTKSPSIKIFCVQASTANWFYLAALYSAFAVTAWNKKQDFSFVPCRKLNSACLLHGNHLWCQYMEPLHATGARVNSHVQHCGVVNADLNTTNDIINGQTDCFSLSCSAKQTHFKAPKESVNVQKSWFTSNRQPKLFCIPFKQIILSKTE